MLPGPLNDPALKAFARPCTYCKEWADGYWGSWGDTVTGNPGTGALPKPPPITEVLYVCTGHYNDLYNEAERVKGDYRLRPMYHTGMQLCGLVDKRILKEDVLKEVEIG